MAQRGVRPTKPEFALRGEIVELVDDAIDIEWQAVALLADASVVVEQPSAPRACLDQLADRETPFAEACIMAEWVAGSAPSSTAPGA